MRFAIVAPAAQPLTIGETDRDLAISPDGTHLVYVSNGGSGTQLIVRAIDQLDAVPLRGSTGARSPFFSPDGRWVGFVSPVNGGELSKVSIMGGPPISLCRIQGGLTAARGASWGPNDTIVFATIDVSTGLLSVPAGGGTPTVLTRPDPKQGELFHVAPSVLPGGQAVLFTIMTAEQSENVAVLDLTTGQHKTLIHGGTNAEYVEPGYLVYAAAGTLRAVRFDAIRLEVLSDSVPVVEQVLTKTRAGADFSVSRHGALVYVLGGATVTTRSLVWVDRQGHEEPIAAPPRAYVYPRISPDGTRVALDVRDQQQGIWIWDLARHTLTRLTDAPAPDQFPVWTRDGRRIVFGSTRAGSVPNLFWQAADTTGTVGRLTTSPNVQMPTTISPDGTRLIVQEFGPKTTGWDLRVLRLDGPREPSGASGANLSPPLAGDSRSTEPLVQTTFNEVNGEISPDGHWLAYQSNESGQNQISVRPFPDVDSGHWPISPTGGTTPIWARSGKELFYRDGTNAVTSVPIQTTPTFRAGTPTRLFAGSYVVAPQPDVGLRTYDVSSDGQRFLMIKGNTAGDQTSTPASMVVVLNWTEELKARVLSK
jgi:Tol biopolymer transport system component